ncbi:MAG: bacteriophage abortive infection AbiH family protein [Bacteroidaceae bacterium]|nr:bacteriophage abortive infection AbiH family protein [Bacteroidaceae bacterium]
MEREFYYSKDGTKVMVVAPIGELEQIIGSMNSFKYKYQHMLIIGNGFDLSLGLLTTYRNFVESSIFKRMYEKRTQEKRDDEQINNVKAVPSLIDYLYGKKFSERWFDIEQALLEYVSIRPDGSFVNNVEDDKKDFDLLCESLVEYLSSLFQNIKLDQENSMRDSIAGQLLMKMNSEKNIIYSFNYTPTENVIKSICFEKKNKSISVHGEITADAMFRGNINDSPIILGIETNDISAIAPGYSFLIKSNNAKYKSSEIATDLLLSKHVIIFGHSLNPIDFGYFEAYFKMMATNTDNERKLTIITRDDISRISLLDSIRKMGVQVRDVFLHNTIEFIITANLDNQDSEDYQKFQSLLEKIEKSDYSI